MEILYKRATPLPEKSSPPNIRWLTIQDYEIFNQHLALCGQKPLSQDVWKEIDAEGTVYCGLFLNNHMIARAAVEKYSPGRWEVADVRVVKSHRCQGYAFEVCAFVLRSILNAGKTATIRTEEDNLAMQRVIARLGFVRDSSQN